MYFSNPGPERGSESLEAASACQLVKQKLTKKQKKMVDEFF